MKAHIIVSTLVTLFFLASSQSTFATQAQLKTPEQLEHDKWLKLRFSEQHKKLIPVVAVADMFFACNKTENSGVAEYQVSYLVEKMTRDLLAEKLNQCLGGKGTQTDVALNHGLYGCFYEQFSPLPAAERQKKMSIVSASISSLSREERQKSFARCVTDQAIRYLK
jgi:hypothetical protein